MSTETSNEHASIVDLSVSQKPDEGNVEGTEISSYEGNGDRDLLGTKEEDCGNFVNDSHLVVEESLCGTRYFIIKSLNYDNIQRSIGKGIWATQVMNEPILEEAFNNSRKVILIFSVNASGFFQGYAQMMSSVGRRRDSLWSQGTGSNNPWGRSFRVKWLQLSNLPFHKTLHLKNPLNEYKPVKISRDCQELPQDIGEALCELIDRESEEDLSLKRDVFNANGPSVESSCSFPTEVYNASPFNMTWAKTSMLHPSFVYHYPAEAGRSDSAQHLSVGLFPPERLPVVASKGQLVRHTNRKSIMIDFPADSEVSSQVDSWQMSGDMSPLGSTVTEDEFLEMSYEEYLEAHSRSIKQLRQPVSEQWKKEESSSKEHDGDNLSNHSDHVSSRKRSRSRSRSQSRSHH